MVAERRVVHEVGQGELPNPGFVDVADAGENTEVLGAELLDVTGPPLVAAGCVLAAGELGGVVVGGEAGAGDAAETGGDVGTGGASGSGSGPGSSPAAAATAPFSAMMSGLR